MQLEAMPTTAHFSLFAIRMPPILPKKLRRVMSSLTLAVNGCVFAPIASHARMSCEQRLLSYTGRWSKCTPEYRQARQNTQQPLDPLDRFTSRWITSALPVIREE